MPTKQLHNLSPKQTEQPKHNMGTIRSPPQQTPDADAKTSTFTEEVEESENASNVRSATEKAARQASGAADSVKSAAQTASEAVTGAAQSVASAAGVGSQTSEAGRDAAANPSSTTVYVGNLFFDVKTEDLKQEFERAGPVVEAKIISDQRGLSKGFVTPLPAHNHTHILLDISDIVSD